MLVHTNINSLASTQNYKKVSKTQNKLDKQRHEFDCLLLGLLNVQVPWIQHPLGKSLSGILNKVKINVWELPLAKVLKMNVRNVCMIYKSADLLSFICSQEVWKLKLCRVHFPNNNQVLSPNQEVLHYLHSKFFVKKFTSSLYPIRKIARMSVVSIQKNSWGLLKSCQ